MSRKKSISIVISFLAVLFLSTFLLYSCGLNEDKRFENYTEELFRQEVSGNAITLHFTLRSPEDWHIYETPISLGQVSTDINAIGAAAENALATLHSYDRIQLSSENRLIYDLLENTFSSAEKMAEYALYEEPLSPLTGTQAQLPVLLSEYQFYSVEDVDIYLKLLKELPDYFHSILLFETAKSENGLFMTPERASAVAKECDAFISMGSENYLHTTFENRLTTLNLPEDKYNSYIEQNATYIAEYVFPAYEELKNQLTMLQNTGQNQNGLSYFADGKHYYELLVENVTGSDRSIKELKSLTYAQITQDLSSMQKILEIEAEDSSSAISFEDSNPSSLLAELKNHLGDNFPTPPDVNISIKYVDSSMEDFLSPAFYLIPPIDNSEENVIYINPLHMSDDLTLFTTLAHEGYPGHLYQTTYFANLNPSPIRSLLGCGGYTEGWATYCEMMSYYYAPISKTNATIIQKNSSVMLGLYALADMGIHYDGWTLMDTVHFFEEYGITDTDAISEIYQLIIGDPANYLKYYIGYLEFLELKKDAIESWGDAFTQERFHREILETGPVPFKLLRERLL